MQARTLMLRTTVAICMGFSLCCAESAIGQVPDGAAKAPAFSHEMVEAFVERQTLWLKPSEKAARVGKVAIPRVCAPIRSVSLAGLPDSNVQVVPDIAEWIISFDPKASERPVIAIEFDAVPIALADLPPATATGDGSILVHGHQAATHGDKLRYEPQPFKNTVGYWTIPSDYATWRIEVDQPGKFVVSLLQGCGQGHGGSQGNFALLGADMTTIAELEFTIDETGHFQNFRWNEAGIVSINEPGVYTIRVSPKKIANVALGDIRMIHLIRQAQ